MNRASKALFAQVGKTLKVMNVPQVLINALLGSTYSSNDNSHQCMELNDSKPPLPSLSYAEDDFAYHQSNHHQLHHQPIIDYLPMQSQQSFQDGQHQPSVQNHQQMTSDTEYSSYESYENQSFLAKEHDYYNENTSGYYGYTYDTSYPQSHQQSMDHYNYDYNYFCQHNSSLQPSCHANSTMTECYYN